MSDNVEATAGAMRRGNDYDLYALPDGLGTDIEHFKAMVRKVQTDARFRENLEAYHKARVAELGKAGIPADKVGVPIWLIAARNPAKYRAVIERLEWAQFWATRKYNRRLTQENMPESKRITKETSQVVEGEMV
jgi:hypothetical protein